MIVFSCSEDEGQLMEEERGGVVGGCMTQLVGSAIKRGDYP